MLNVACRLFSFGIYSHCEHAQMQSVTFWF